MLDEIRTHWRYQPALKIVIIAIVLLTLGLELGLYLGHSRNWANHFLSGWASIFILVNTLVPPRLWCLPIAMASSGMLTLLLSQQTNGAFDSAAVFLHASILILCLCIYYLPNKFLVPWFKVKGKS